MFNLGFTELVAIGFLALVFIGPKQLPAVARTVGRLINEFKRATGDLAVSVAKVKETAQETVAEVEQEIMNSVNVEQKPSSNLSENGAEQGHSVKESKESHDG